MSDSAQRAGVSPTAVDVGGVIDAGEWSGYQKWIVFLVALTVVFDGIDNSLLGIAIPTLMNEWAVPRSAFAPVVSLGYFGMMIGGALGGLMGDRMGRRTALLGSVVLFGVMTLAAVFVGGPMQLGIVRWLAGIGLGGAMPNAAALAAEFVPLRKRPVAVTVTIVCVPLGATLAGLLGMLLPVMGWRALFTLGGVVPIIAAVLLRPALPESPRFLTRMPARWPELGRTLRRMGHRVPDQASFADTNERKVAKVSIGTLFGPAFRADTLPLWAAFFSCLLAVYLCFSWLTSLLTRAGFDAGTASTGFTAFNLGGVAGALLGGWAIARVGSRAAMLTMAGLAVAGAAGLALHAISPAAPILTLIAMLAFTGAMINGVQTTMYALAAHVYPSGVRATGVGAAVSFGRSGAILTGYVGDWALRGGHDTFFGLVAASMAVAFVALALVRRHVGVVPR